LKLDLTSANQERRSTYAGLDQQINVETRFKIIRTMQALYWEMYEDG